MTLVLDNVLRSRRCPERRIVQHNSLFSFLSKTLRHRVMLAGQAGKLCVSRLRPLLTSRLVSSSAPVSGRIPDGFGKIKERQKFFNLDNGLR